MKIIFKIVLLFLMVTSFMLGNHNTIPTESWVYKSVERLHLAGYFENLARGSRPYGRSEIVTGLLDIKQPEKIAKGLQTDYQLLYNEFLPDIQKMENRKAVFWVKCDLKASYDFDEQTDNQVLLPEFALDFNNNFSLKYSAVFDKQLDNDPLYIGREYADFGAYQEQIYLAYKKNGLLVQFGRDYIDWGYGKKGNLLISDNSRPFDMLHLASQSKRFRFDAVIAQLDDIANNNRYLSATRLAYTSELNFTLGIGHAALYGGENQFVDFAFSNPVSFSYAEQHNNRQGLNSLVYADFSWRFSRQFHLYGELLIDDYQAENKVQGDMEPNEIGFTLGGEFINFMGLNGFCEFTQIRNRTYNVSYNHSFEKYIHRNYVIGHQLGNDVQFLNFEANKWMMNKINTGGGYYLKRKGEGTVLGEFTTPWMDVDGDYTEDIPYGTVETTHGIYFNCNYFIKTNLILNLQLGYRLVGNYEHIDDNEHAGLFGHIQVQFYRHGFLY